MSNDTDNLSDPPRGAYRVLARIAGSDVRCVMDHCFATAEDASTFAGIAYTEYDVAGTEVIFDASSTPDPEF